MAKKEQKVVVEAKHENERQIEVEVVHDGKHYFFLRIDGVKVARREWTTLVPGFIVRDRIRKGKYAGIEIEGDAPTWRKGGTGS